MLRAVWLALDGGAVAQFYVLARNSFLPEFFQNKKDSNHLALPT